MSLQIWLPLTKDLRQQGLSNTTVTNNGTTYSSTGGKLGGNYTSTATSQTIIINFSNLSTMLANGKTYSLSCWVKPTGIPDTGWVIKLGSNTCGLWWAKSEARWVWNENDNGKRCANPTISSDYTNWHHLVIVVDKTVNGKITTKQYVDGALAANYPGSTWDCSSHSQPAGTTITISPYVSQLNDIRLYDHCLSPMEVKELAKGLVLHYPLNRQGWGQENLLRGSNVIGSGTTVYGWVPNGSATNMEILSDGSLHYKYNISNTKYIPSITTNTVVPCEFSKTYFYSMDLKFDKAITLGTTTPMHYWVGARNSDSITNTSCNGNLTGIQTQFISNHSGTLPANTWVHITTKFTFPAAATSGGYNYPAIRCFVYGSALTETTTGEVNVWMKNCKVEEGSVETPWCPHVEDALATTMGLNSTIEYDCSGFYNNGIHNGVTYSSDTPKYQVSTTFNVNADSVKIFPVFSNGQTITELSIACWFKTNTLNNTSPNIFSLGANSFIRVRISNSTTIWWYTRVASTSAGASKTCKTLTDNIWHHVVYTFKNGIETMYIDGDSVGTNDKTGTGTYLTCGDINENNWVLAGYTSSSERFLGSESDFRIYTTALSADDVKSLYQNSAYIDSSGNVYGAVYEEV